MAPPSNALHVAAREGNLPAVREILSSNVQDVNSRDHHSRTPLHLAAWAGQADLVKMLCEANADVGASAVDDLAAIHFATQKGHCEVVRILLASGAYVNARTRKGMTPLHFAVQGGREDLTKLLIRKGANLSTENKAGKTPVDLAPDGTFRAVIRDAELERDARRSKSVKEKPTLGLREEGKCAGRRGEQDEEPKPVTVAERPVSQGEDVQAARQAEEAGDAKPITVPERPVTVPDREDYAAEDGESQSRAIDGKGSGIVSQAEKEKESMEPPKKKPRVALSHLAMDVASEDDYS